MKFKIHHSFPSVCYIMIMWIFEWRFDENPMLRIINNRITENIYLNVIIIYVFPLVLTTILLYSAMILSMWNIRWYIMSHTLYRRWQSLHISITLELFTLLFFSGSDLIESSLYICFTVYSSYIIICHNVYY